MGKSSVTAKTGIWAILFFTLILAGSCWAAESSGDNPVKSETKEQYRQEILGTKGQTDKEYVIGYRDILYVEVYGEGSMAVGPASSGPSTAADKLGKPGKEEQDTVRGRGAGAEVGTDGRISLRNIGDVYVVGMTMTQLADYLKKLYSTVFAKPTVITSLIQSNSRQYTMMGQVKSPGIFHLDYPITVVKAVAKAGGLTEWANSEVTIIRQPNEQTGKNGSAKGEQKGQRFNFDYDDFLKGKNIEKNIMLEPGDVVVVH